MRNRDNSQNTDDSSPSERALNWNSSFFTDVADSSTANTQMTEAYFRSLFNRRRQRSNLFTCSPAAIAGCRDPKTDMPITLSYLKDWVDSERLIDPGPMNYRMDQSQHALKSKLGTGRMSKPSCRHNPFKVEAHSEDLSKAGTSQVGPSNIKACVYPRKSPSISVLSEGREVADAAPMPSTMHEKPQSHRRTIRNHQKTNR